MQRQMATLPHFCRQICITQFNRRESMPSETIAGMDIQQDQAEKPFWESTPFWGFVSLLATIVFTILRCAHEGSLVVLCCCLGLRHPRVNYFVQRIKEEISTLLLCACDIGNISGLSLLDRHCLRLHPQAPRWQQRLVPAPLKRRLCGRDPCLRPHSGREFFHLPP